MRTADSFASFARTGFVRVALFGAVLPSKAAVDWAVSTPAQQGSSSEPRRQDNVSGVLG